MVATCTLLPYFFSNLDVTRWSQLFLGAFLVPQFHDKPTHASEYRLDVISSLDFDPIRHDETTIDWSGESCVSLRSISLSCISGQSMIDHCFGGAYGAMKCSRNG